jgi:hypothetical protein
LETLTFVIESPKPPILLSKKKDLSGKNLLLILAR